LRELIILTDLKPPFYLNIEKDCCILNSELHETVQNKGSCDVLTKQPQNTEDDLGVFW